MVFYGWRNSQFVTRGSTKPSPPGPSPSWTVAMTWWTRKRSCWKARRGRDERYENSRAYFQLVYDKGRPPSWTPVRQPGRRRSRGDPLLRRRHPWRTATPPRPRPRARRPPRPSPFLNRRWPWTRPTSPLILAIGRAEQPLHAGDTFDESSSREVRRHPEVAGGPEPSPGRRPPLPSRISSASSALVSAVRPAIGRPSRPCPTGIRRTRPGFRARDAGISRSIDTMV